MQMAISRNEIGFLVNRTKQQAVEYALHQNLKMSSNLKQDQVRISTFTIDDIDINNGQVRIKKDLSDGNSIWVDQLPSVICNTTVQYKKNDIKKLRHLLDCPQLTFLNKVNRYKQNMIFDILSTNMQTRSFLLPHYVFEINTLKYVLDEWEHIFLLQVKSDGLRRMIAINRSHMSNEEDYVVLLGEKTWDCKKIHIMDEVLSIIKNKNYLIVKGISPLKWEGIKIEARVYVQKDTKKQWQVRAMIAKNDAMGYDHYFVNFTYDLDVLLQTIYPNTYRYILQSFTQYSIHASLCLERFLPDLASCYFDYLIDEIGNIFLVYFGGWEQQEWMVRLQPDKRSWFQYWDNALQYSMCLIAES